MRCHQYCIVVGILTVCQTVFAQDLARQAPNSRPSWMWIHSGVAIQVAGSFADWATSWKQPEGNQLLAESGGQYSGRFYRTGTERKLGCSAGLTAVSYALAWRWPKLRRYLGIFNMSIGATFAASAVRNTINNPYYKP